MPTYSYRCEDEDCGTEFDLVLPMASHCSVQVCVKCGCTANKYISSVPNVDTHFKGSYRDQNPCDTPCNFSTKGRW